MTDDQDFPMRELSSPNCDERKDGLIPSYLIMHYTEITAQETKDRFMDPSPTGGQVSAHYVIDVDGAVTRFVPEDKRAWHAGVSYFDRVKDFNSRSIGIELVNPGVTAGHHPFPQIQMESLIALSRDIMGRWPIPPANVLGHSDIAPERKIDPGELFDWQMIADRGIGLWPVPDDADYDASADWLADATQMQAAMERAGYDGYVDTVTLVTAFQRHFQPEVFASVDQMPGTPDRETAARLNRLIRLRHS